MKLEFKEVQKALDYISKEGDRGFISISGINKDTAFEGVIFEFMTLTGDSASIFLPTNEKAFSKLTISERF